MRNALSYLCQLRSQFAKKYLFSCSDSFQDVTLEVGLNLNSSRKFCHFDIGMFSRYSASSAKHLIKAGSILEMLSRK